MNTTTHLKHAAILISSAFLALPGHAAQNFSKTHSFSTGNSQFGMTASLFAKDSYTVPTAKTTGSYSVIAGGNVKGKILGITKTALEGTGTAKVMPNGSATFTGNLKVIGLTVLNVSNANISTYSSPLFVKEWTARTSYSVPVFGFPVNIDTRVKASVDVRLRADAVFTPTEIGVPQVALSVGPEADLAGSAEASVGVGIPGLASVGAGVGGSLRLGKAALKGKATVTPTSTQVRATNGIGFTVKKGATAEIKLVAETAGVNGRLYVFAEAELFPFGTAREEHTIASFSTGSASLNLLGPITYTWF